MSTDDQKPSDDTSSEDMATRVANELTPRILEGVLGLINVEQLRREREAHERESWRSQGEWIGKGVTVLLLLNGAAAIAILGVMGAVIGSGHEWLATQLVDALSSTLVGFARGAALAALASIGLIGYWAILFGTISGDGAALDRWAKKISAVLLIGIVITLVASLWSFLSAAQFAADHFSMLAKWN
jgi:cytochrome bd-type quinol oxidase subunit 2